MNDDQAPINPPPLTDEAIRAALFQMSQDITTQAKAMVAQANREVVPRANQQVPTVACRLKDFSWMNPPTFYGFKFEEDPYNFIYEIYNILYAMGLYTSEKVELATYQLKDAAQTWHVQWRDNRTLTGGLVTWEVLNNTFLYRLFPREKR